MSKQNLASDQQEHDNGSMENAPEPAEGRYSDRAQKAHTADYLCQATLPPSCQSGDQEGTADEARQSELRSDSMHTGVRESQPEPLPQIYSSFELPGNALAGREGMTGASIDPTRRIFYPMNWDDPLPPETRAHTIPMLSSSASTRSNLRSFQSLAL